MKVLEALKQKTAKQTHRLILLVNDPDAQKVLAAWTWYGAVYVDRELVDGEDPSAAAQTMWPRIDFAKLSRLSGVPYGSAIDVFSRLREAEIIYPDGTAQADAVQLIAAHVAGNMSAAMRGQR